VRAPILYALAMLTVMGCQDPDGPSLLVQMDSTVYTRDTTGSATASFTVTNLGDAPAYLQGCGRPITLIFYYRITAGRWAAYGGGSACVLVTNASQVLRPGQSYRDVFGWDLPGTYRLHVLYGTLPGDAFALHAPGAPFELR
jgi:hypothetical protein